VTPNKSTNGRFSAGWAFLRRFAPDLSQDLALRWFATPPRLRGELDRKIAYDCEPFTLRVREHGLRAFRAGDGPAIALLHGWGGHAGDFDAFIQPLVSAGFSLLAVDAPAHGASPGRRSSLPEFAETFAALARVERLHGVIAHSFGCAAVTWALSRGVQVERAVYYAPLVKVSDQFRRFAAHMQLPIERLNERGERRYGVSLFDLDAERIARSMTTPLLVLHDESDRAIAVEEANHLVAAWPGAQLRQTTGLGHKRRLLSDGALMEDAIRFLQGRSLA
jgi:pimeloyl-ACP methyl ester carboxylesterase